ncbi:MAG: hypothetical protein ACE14L_17430 [Terriglobales bacterium]
MQAAKDSFYIALRDRLAALNPQRTITLAGDTRPAIVVVENTGLGATEVAQKAPVADCFCLRFGAVRQVDGFAGVRRPLMTMECAIAYRTSGPASDASDRGRALAALSGELMAICAPPATPKLDYTQTPVVELGSTVSWEAPQFGAVDDAGNSIGCEARMTLFFFPEVNG